MNEVTKIHLGRQSFTISRDAYKELLDYLDDIKKQVKDAEVSEEVEARMSELLAERGIKDGKVILPKDVKFLKAQLGEAEDFHEDNEEQAAYRPAYSKRLFRDTDHAMLAGVSAGLGNFFGVDPVLFRAIFVIGVLTGGWGILIYIMLWLLVPEAKTPSDRLQMAGKPVTVDGLKDVVKRADVKGAAQRANNSIAQPINSFFSVVLKIIGIGFVAAGLSAILGLIAAASYTVIHRGGIAQDNIFPIGYRENLLLDISMAVAALVAVFVVLLGMAMFLRKWPIRSWITGVLAGLFFIGLVSGSVLAADVVPTVRDRYNANTHTTTRSVKPFTQVKGIGPGVDINIQTADKYSVSFKYFDNPDISKIKTTVSNGVLLIDSSQFDWHRHCQTICLPPVYETQVTVYAPITPAVDLPDVQGIKVAPGSSHYYFNQ